MKRFSAFFHSLARYQSGHSLGSTVDVLGRDFIGEVVQLRCDKQCQEIPLSECVISRLLSFEGDTKLLSKQRKIFLRTFFLVTKQTRVRRVGFVEKRCFRCRRRFDGLVMIANVSSSDFQREFCLWNEARIKFEEHT